MAEDPMDLIDALITEDPTIPREPLKRSPVWTWNSKAEDTTTNASTEETTGEELLRLKTLRLILARMPLSLIATLTKTAHGAFPPLSSPLAELSIKLKHSQLPSSNATTLMPSR
jgi:hypothetical protein